jgi:hypothetical protein
VACERSCITPDKLISGYYEELFEMALYQGTTVVLMMDQRLIGQGFDCLMLSARFGERAVPLAWRVKKTEGNIGFEVQEELLKSVFSFLPPGLKIVRMGDRFYGTGRLVSLCQSFGWQYRLRLKGNLHFYEENGAFITPQGAHKLGLKRLEKVRFGQDGPITEVGILQEEGHPQPWFIAMNEKATDARVLDYSMRWGIEALFSDLKSIGFCITQTQLRHPERIERLILILTIALYWAVSVGMDPAENPLVSKKKTSDL